jgi:hypothetical protein
MTSQSLPIYLPTPYFNSGNRHMFHADVRTRQSTNKDKACEGIDTSTTVSSEPRIMSYNPSFDSYNASQACCDVPPRQQSFMDFSVSGLALLRTFPVKQLCCSSWVVTHVV